MGMTIVPLRYRQLEQAEIDTPCYKIAIDSYYLNKLVVLALYANNNAGNPGYSIYEYTYGNLAQTVRVIPTAPSPYISFGYPTNSFTQASSTQFQWDFLNLAGGNTNYTSYQDNEKLVDHLQVDAFQWTGAW